jgi:hypothetical protein
MGSHGLACTVDGVSPVSHISLEELRVCFGEIYPNGPSTTFENDLSRLKLKVWRSGLHILGKLPIEQWVSSNSKKMLGQIA